MSHERASRQIHALLINILTLRSYSQTDLPEHNECGAARKKGGKIMKLTIDGYKVELPSVALTDAESKMSGYERSANALTYSPESSVPPCERHH